MIVRPNTDPNMLSVYEPSKPIGTLRLLELLEHVKDAGTTREVKEFAMNQMAAFLYLERVKD